MLIKTRTTFLIAYRKPNLKTTTVTCLRISACNDIILQMAKIFGIIAVVIVTTQLQIE